jgi:hypothetical protein
MTITDGAIMFGACVLSFGLGYAFGAFRVTRFVDKKLAQVNLNLEHQARELQQFVTRLGEGSDKP